MSRALPVHVACVQPVCTAPYTHPSAATFQPNATNSLLPCSFGEEAPLSASLSASLLGEHQDIHVDKLPKLLDS